MSTFERDRTIDARRRRAMAWLLHEAGQPFGVIGPAMGITAAHASHLARGYESIVRRRVGQEYDAAWAERLRAAGAIGGECYVLGDPPP